MTVRWVDVRRGLPLRPIVVAALGTLVVGLGAVVVTRTQFALHACLPGEGPVGWLGLRLALLRDSVDCPEGTLALGGSASRSALVVVSVALPTLLVHLVAAVCGASLSALLARAASGIRVVLRAAWRVLPGVPRAPGVRSRRVIGRVLVGVLRRAGDTAHPDRGPPVLLAA
ncbi:hypothetical protein [Pengzhenrongella phosphoraccumulans]|uniref:hypothetical protein n=1 Tax=Pengzhenrongella phosphoraccumulans TaxID=3114394 RepID=UPI00388E92FD